MIGHETPAVDTSRWTATSVVITITGLAFRLEVSLDPGAWTYFSTIHPSMTGSLVVEA